MKLTETTALITGASSGIGVRIDFAPAPDAERPRWCARVDHGRWR